MSKYNLITGATGIVGIHVMLELLRRGEPVKAMIRPSSDKSIVGKVFAYYGDEQLIHNIEWFEGDMLDRDSLYDAVIDCKCIYHTAAMVSFSKKDHPKLWQTNVNATADLIDCAISNGIKSFCHVSSIGALGHEPNGTITEETPWQPDSNRSVYSQSKYRQEMEVWRGIESGLNATIVNPGVILGPGLIGRSSSQILQTVEKGVPFYVEGQTGYIDARDLAHIMIELTEHQFYNERYIVVGHNCEVKRIQELFAKALNKKAPSIKAGHRTIMLAAHINEAWARVSGKSTALTVESARSMGGYNTYSSKKLINTINIQFTPLEESILNMVNFLKYIKHENK